MDEELANIRTLAAFNTQKGLARLYEKFFSEVYDSPDGCAHLKCSVLRPEPNYYMVISTH